MSKQPQYRAFAVHPTTYLSSARIIQGLSLFDEEAYVDGVLQPGYNIQPRTLERISEFIGCELTPHELLQYCVSNYHDLFLTRYKEFSYYRNILKEVMFVRFEEGAYIKRRGLLSKPVVEYYFLKFPEHTHSQFYMNLYDLGDPWLITSLMPGFMHYYTSECTVVHKKVYAGHLLSYWYGYVDEQHWSVLKPTLREKKLPWEPEYEWVFDEASYPEFVENIKKAYPKEN